MRFSRDKTKSDGEITRQLGLPNCWDTPGTAASQLQPLELITALLDNARERFRSVPEAAPHTAKNTRPYPGFDRSAKLHRADELGTKSDSGTAPSIWLVYKIKHVVKTKRSGSKTLQVCLSIKLFREQNKTVSFDVGDQVTLTESRWLWSIAVSSTHCLISCIIYTHAIGISCLLSNQGLVQWIKLCI